MRGNIKRNIVVGTMAVLVCAAVGLNWKYSSEEAVQKAEEAGTKILGEAALVSGQEEGTLAESTVYEGDDYFASARLTRQQARDSAISLLEDAAKQEDADQSVANQASESIQVLASYTLKEAQIENLVTAKGYQDCVAFMGDDSLSIVVSTKDGGAERHGCCENYGYRHDRNGLCRQRNSNYGRKLAVVFSENPC